MKKLFFLVVLQLCFLNVSSQEISKLPLPIYKFMQEWLNVPYLWAGRTKKGVDCSGLTSAFARAVYQIEIKPLAYEQWNLTRRVKRDSLQPGNLVFFHSPYSPSRWHVGVYLGNDAFLHAPKKGDSVKISLLTANPYNFRFKGGGSLKK